MPPTVINDPAKPAVAAEQVAAPAPGTPEYDAAMQAVADARMGGGDPVKAEKPADVPEKFWNAEKGVVDYVAMAKSYNELSTKLGQQKPAVEKPAVVDTPVVEQTPEQKAAAEAAAVAAASKGVDFAALSAEYAEKGALTPETYAALDKKGFPKQVVDTYIEGQKSIAASYDKAAFDAAGSKDQFTKMVDWAGKNLDGDSQKAFNDAVDSQDVGRLKLAVTGLRAAYEAAEGTDPTLIAGGNAGDSTVGFKSMAEQKAAQSDPRYKKDAAYRETVYKRIAASNFQSVQVVGA